MDVVDLATVYTVDKKAVASREQVVNSMVNGRVL